MTDQSSLPTLRDIPAEDVVWSNSMLKSMRSCEQKFVFQYADGLSTEGSYAMQKGSWFHFALAMQGWAKGHKDDTLLVRPETFDPRIGGIELRFEWEPNGIDHPVFSVTNRQNEDGSVPTYPVSVSGALDCLTEQVYDYMSDAERAALEDEGKDLPSITRNLVTRYLFEYREDLKAEKVLLVEARWERQHEGFTFGGTVDRVVETPDGLVVVRDHKTHQNMPDSVFRLTDSQLHFYAWGLRPLLEEHGIVPVAVEFDYIVSRKPASVRVTKAGNLYKNMGQVDLFTLMNELKEQGLDPKAPQFADAIKKAKAEPNPFFNRKMMPLNSAVVGNILRESIELLEGVYPRMLTGRAVRNVDWFSCRSCSFAEVCMGNLYGNDTDLLLDAFGETKITTTENYEHNPDSEEITA